MLKGNSLCDLIHLSLGCSWSSAGQFYNSLISLEAGKGINLLNTGCSYPLL